MFEMEVEIEQDRLFSAKPFGSSAKQHSPPETVVAFRGVTPMNSLVTRTPKPTTNNRRQKGSSNESIRKFNSVGHTRVQTPPDFECEGARGQRHNWKVNVI